MRKLILTERQYNNIKNVLIENAINEQAGDFSYIVQSDKVSFENSEDKFMPELQIYKGAKFVPDNQGNLVATTSFNFASTEDGTIAYSPDSDQNFVKSDDEIPRYTYKDKVIYICKEGKFTAPSRSKFKYFAEDSPAPELVKNLGKLCQTAKSQKTSYGAEAVGGGKSYSQKNDYIVKSEKGTTIKIPKGTGYAFKQDKNGASFRLPGNKFGWFGCKSKTFQIEGVKYKDEKGSLSGNIIKNICGTTPSKDSSKPEEVKFKGGGGFDTSTSSFDTSKFDQYI